MQSESNKVTIVIPLYNPEMEFLHGTLQIIIKNEDNLIDKIILVDDGSVVSIKNYNNELKKYHRKLKLLDKKIRVRVEQEMLVWRWQTPRLSYFWTTIVDHIKIGS